ncbi:MAG: amidophosphoribosyltransferase [Clostridia bacterium]|nr:amidophosphoribosyltransferase [Clostridia bacterium]
MSIHEECGVFGIFNRNLEHDAVQETYLALYALQHRGQVSCGIAARNGDNVDCITELGTVPDVFNKDKLASLTASGKGNVAIGHVRYSAQGEEDEINSQPMVMSYAKGSISIVNNGSLVSTAKLRSNLEAGGSVFQTNSNAEMIVHLIVRHRLQTENIEKAISRAMSELEGAYSFIIMSPKKLIAVRDPKGFRPLCYGKLGNSYVIASESCAIQSIGGEVIRDIEPGEILVITEDAVYSNKDNCGQKTSMCIFEHVYLARPDSVIDGASVHRARLNAGKFLAIEHPVEADVVVGVPDSGIDAAIGYANESGIPFGIGLIKNRYIGRTFIQTTQRQRERSVQIKLNPLGNEIEGKRIVLVDDSIVRGTTCAKLIKKLRDAGAKEIHMRISSPPFINPCYFGTDISSKDKLIACKLDIDEICRFIGADSLGYLSRESMMKVAENSKVEFCSACFTGEYPVDVTGENFVDKYSKKIN